MRILQAVNNINITCGASRQILSFLNILQKKGHEVFILVPKGTNDMRLKDMNISYKEIDYCYENRNPFNLLFHIINIFNFIRKNRFEIVHCHHFYQAFLFSFFKNIFHYQLIQTIRQDFDDNIGSIPHYSADKVIFLSEITRKKKIPYLKNKRSYLVPNPVIFDTSLNINGQITEHEFTLAFIGRFSKDKNINLIVDALKMITEEKLKIIFIGSGVEENKIREFSSSTIHKVEILEERYNIDEIYIQADVILLPSLIEGVPNVVLEAGFFSKPIITSNVGGIPDIIRDGENGIILNNLSAPFELKEKILMLKNDVLMRKRLGEKLNEKIMDLPSQEINYQNIMEVYNS